MVQNLSRRQLMKIDIQLNRSGPGEGTRFGWFQYLGSRLNYPGVGIFSEAAQFLIFKNLSIIQQIRKFWLGRHFRHPNYP